MLGEFKLRNISIITGTSIVLMTIIAGFTMGGLFADLFAMNKDQFTINKSGFESKYLIGIYGWIFIFITDVIVSWGLYKFYSVKNRNKAKIMGILRLVYSIILLIGIIQLVRSYFELNGVNVNLGKAYEMLFNFQSIWQFGLIIFGLHLIYLSNLVCDKHKIMQLVAFLLFLAGVGYSGSNIADLFITNYEQIRSKIELFFILPMIFGELSLALLLLLKGGKSNNFI